MCVVVARQQTGRYSHAVIRLRVRRDPWYYLLRITFVSVILSAVEACSFLIDVRDLGGRFGVSGTMLLSAVAFYFVTLEQLPKVAYLTRTDVWNMCTFLLLFLSTMENGASYWILSRGWRDEAWVAAMEWWCCAGYVAGVVGSTAWFAWPLLEYQRDVARIEAAAAARKKEKRD